MWSVSADPTKERLFYFHYTCQNLYYVSIKVSSGLFDIVKFKLGMVQIKTELIFGNWIHTGIKL